MTCPELQICSGSYAPLPCVRHCRAIELSTFHRLDAPLSRGHVEAYAPGIFGSLAVRVHAHARGTTFVTRHHRPKQGP